jgi:hypothetical protein
MATPSIADDAGATLECVYSLCPSHCLSKGKSRSQFKVLVAKAWSPEVVRTKKVVRGCARRARSYIMACCFLYTHGDEEEAVKKEVVGIEDRGRFGAIQRAQMSWQ